MAKKKVETTRTVELRELIDPDHREISITQQCQLLGLPLSTYYYKSVPVSPAQLDQMDAISEIYEEFPSYGTRRMSKAMQEENWPIGRKRARRLMQLLGLEAIYQHPKTSIANPDHKIYPYLLKGMDINRPNQVWCTDITYIRLNTGWSYLMAVMDWHSRRVISWGLSNTMDTNFCTRVLEEALKLGKPEYFNTDQGSQFTSASFTGILLREGIKISMDGRGRYLDNILIERLWRTVKYEDIFISGYETLPEARAGLFVFFSKYNNRRLHQALDYKTPDHVWRNAA